jgi:hypothetical protein
LPRSQNRRILEAVDVTVIVLLDAHRSLPTFAGWRSVVPIVARGSLEASVERMESQVDGISHDDGLMTQRLHHTRPFLSKFAPSVTM